MSKVKTPECDRMLAVHEDSNKIGFFLDWLKEQDIYLGKPHTHADDCLDEDGRYTICGYREGEFVFMGEDFEHLLARYFRIDLKKVEQERRAILEAIRNDTNHP